MNMIIAAMAALGVPAPLRRAAGWAAGILLLVALLGTAKCTYDRALITRHDAAQTIAVQKAAVKASDAASGAAASTRNEVEQTNDQARRDAAVSDDPLRDGFNRLRTGQARDHRPAPGADPVRR